MIATFLGLPRFDSPALCATEGQPDDWFDGEREANAREVCRRCPSLEPCLAWAVTNSEAGIWANTSHDERKKLRGDTPAPRRMRSDCVNGHPFTPDNTQYTARSRRCRTCHNRATQDSKRRAAS